MIILILSVLQANINFSSFKVDGLYAQDIKFYFLEEKDWYKILFEGGWGLNFYSSKCEIGLSDLTLGIGVKRNVLGVGLSLYPLFRLPIGSKVEQRSFSIDGYGYGIGMGLERKIFGSYIKMNGRLITFDTEPNIRTFIANTEMKFNPDTLTFSLNFSYEEFYGGDYYISSIYISPYVSLLKWKLFGLYLGVDFRVTKEIENVAELELLGVNTGRIGTPPWKISFGILSTEIFRTSKRLIHLRVILLDEKGDPARGLLSLSDSGSFEIKNGEILFELTKGIYPISIYAKDCIPVDTTIILKEDTELLLTIQHRKALGVIEGVVLDAESDIPLYASILIKNSEYRIIYTDSTTGSYRVILPSGDYIIQAKAKGYFPWTSLTEIIEGNVTILDFMLLPSR